MKRLTRSNPSGSSSFVMGGEPIPTIMLKYTDMQVVLDRLAAYEDTGLMPEQIEKAMEDCADTFAENQFAICEINEMGAIDHLRELIQAEKAGRLVVLPCLKGVPLYVLTDDGIERTKCRKIVFMERSGKPFPVVIAHVPNIPSGIAHWEFWNIDFGKTVFLTRAEAEAALKKEGKNNEAN